MASELDRKYDAVLAEQIGAGGRFRIDRDAEGRAIVGNFPATLPALFQAFSALHGATEAVIAGRRAADLRRARRALGPAGAGAGGKLGRRQGRPGRHRDAQLPGLDPLLHGGR